MRGEFINLLQETFFDLFLKDYPLSLEWRARGVSGLKQHYLALHAEA
jgi:hypothetical protein